MTLLNVGFVSYINAYPLNAAFQQNKVPTDAKIIYDIPTQLNKKLKTGELDIALTSALVYLDNKEQFDFIPHLGIGAKGPAMSVNLYLKGEVSELDGETIGVTHQSAISIALLKTLCDKYWKVKPLFEPLDPASSTQEFKAILLIGDEALKQGEMPGYKTLDLAKVWHETTLLGFTFALFVVQRDALSKKRVEIESFVQDVQKSYQWSKENRDQVVQMGADQTGLPKELLTTYYNTLCYELTKEEMRGLSVFDYLRTSDFHVQKKRP